MEEKSLECNIGNIEEEDPFGFGGGLDEEVEDPFGHGGGMDVSTDNLTPLPASANEKINFSGAKYEARTVLYKEHPWGYPTFLSGHRRQLGRGLQADKKGHVKDGNPSVATFGHVPEQSRMEDTRGR